MVLKIRGKARLFWRRFGEKMWEAHPLKGGVLLRASIPRRKNRKTKKTA